MDRYRVEVGFHQYLILEIVERTRGKDLFQPKSLSKHV
jgi:hypothetical protein